MVILSEENKTTSGPRHQRRDTDTTTQIPSIFCKANESARVGAKGRNAGPGAEEKFMAMRRDAAAWCIAACCAVTLAGGVAAEQQFEQLTVAKLPPANPHRVYISDIAISHIVDGKLHVVDGDTLRYLGLVATGYAGQATLSPDRSELYVATTYYTRLSRGERADVVDIYDTATLQHKGEIAIPPKHAPALHYKGTIRTSSDGRWLLVQNATPATSVTVVDLKAHKVASEVPTPGCWIVIPSHGAPQRFSTICGDGTLMTVTLSDDGKSHTLKHSKPFFSPDTDPIFVQEENLGDRHMFVSFRGRIHTANLSGDVASIEAPWSLLSKADEKQGWRPGGYQPLAVHRKTGRLFVAMHPNGKEGSHKDAAREIWIYDLASQKRIARVPGNNAIAITASQDDAPLLFALDGLNMGLVVYDAGKKVAVKHRLDPLAETAFLMETH